MSGEQERGQMPGSLFFFTVEQPEKKELQIHCGESEVNIQQCCKHCTVQEKQHEQVTPKFLKGQFCLKLDDEGTYECTATGLIFEVTGPVTIEYSVLSWTRYAAYVKDPWIIVGPIFDIKCTSSILTSIQFPHTLCLNDHLSEKPFKVFHFKKNGPEFECSIDHSTTHVKWHVSSLSPVGPVIERYAPVYYHGVVILYKVINDHPSLKFRVYIATNNNSFIKDISKTVRRSLNKFIKIEKPPCHKLLQNGKKYRLNSDPEADITPEEIQFGDDSTLAEKPFFEVYLEQPVELMLSLVNVESEEVVWKAKLRECDWTAHNQNDNEQKKSLNCVGDRQIRTCALISEDLKEPSSSFDDPMLTGVLQVEVTSFVGHRVHIPSFDNVAAGQIALLQVLADFQSFPLRFSFPEKAALELTLKLVCIGDTWD
ncbi:NACHT, LRR and PYD domains-containing protein 1b allele 5-like [Candoia aspera]|uniref:NACHT, LRR and PYD domains-containing protein 1b allele 5-like n=1 Tax=Candoia aspera TaxID=51853 RepID=UPI002FD7E094